jgi:Ca2+-binding EF-hand superfamily protein
MRRKNVAVGVLLCALGVLETTHSAGPVAGTERPASYIVLLLPGVEDHLGLRLDLLVDGQSPTAAWEAFLDRLFDWFDLDGDGSLSRAEASRILRLPLPGRNELTIDFDKLDADRNGKVSREELKAYCRANGFGPAVVTLEPQSAEDARLADLFRRHLDNDLSGKLTRSQLKRAPESLHRCDLNEDEFLDLSELLSSAPTGPRPSESQIKVGAAGSEGNSILRVDVGAKTVSPTLEGLPGQSLTLVAATVPGGLHRIYGPAGRWLISLRTTRTVPDIRSVKEFLVAQFKNAVGVRPALTKADLERDTGLGGLADLFSYADRNHDDRLTLTELEDYLGLVEAGVRAQIWIQVNDHGRNPFHLLDCDGDGRLSYRELTQSTNLVHPDLVECVGLPLQFQLEFGGPTVKSWGGVPIPAVVRRNAKASGAIRVPPWFRAMDKNGDGIISPREFLGPPELFRKLDSNGDGVISPEEALHFSNGH